MESIFQKDKDYIYHCKKCGEIPLLDFSDSDLDIICRKHKILNVPISEFYSFFNFDYECSICNKSFNKSSLIYCFKCKIFYCDKCKNKHIKDKNKSHFIVNAIEKNNICDLHNKKYDKFCFKCKINLCELCINNHNNHYIELIKDNYPLDEDILKFDEIYVELLNKIEKKEIKQKEKSEIKKKKEEEKKLKENQKENEDVKKLDNNNQVDLENGSGSESYNSNNSYDSYEDYKYEDYEKNLDYLNKQKKCLKIKKLLVAKFSNNVSDYNYINNINNIIRCTIIKEINIDYSEFDIKYIDNIETNNDLNNIKNKISIKSIREDNSYFSIWCIKKLNDIQINSTQILKLIALGTSRNEIILLNIINFRFYQIIKEHNGTIYSLDQYKNDTKYFFSSSEDGTINIYKLDNNYKYILFQKLEKSEEKKGNEINKVIILSNKLLVSSDRRSITIWKSNFEEKDKIHYEDFYEIIINNDTCQLLEVNPSIFIATQYTTNTFQVYKNDDGKFFPLIGELENLGTHGKSSNGLCKINDKLVCSSSDGFFYVVCIDPIQVIQKYSINDETILYMYSTNDNYIYCNYRGYDIIQYKILFDEDNNFVELSEIDKYNEKDNSLNRQSILPLDDGRIFIIVNKNQSKYYQLIA